MKPRVYVDTSVFSACFDSRAPDRKALTEMFFAAAPALDLFSSEVTRRELMQTPDASVRSEMIRLLDEYRGRGSAAGGRRNCRSLYPGRCSASGSAAGRLACCNGRTFAGGLPCFVELQTSGECPAQSASSCRPYALWFTPHRYHFSTGNRVRRRKHVSIFRL